MKKSKQKSKSSHKKPSATATSNTAPVNTLSRRDMLGNIAFSAAAVAAVGTGGYYLVSEVSASISEGDLSKIGNGTPTVVQIHDPSCGTCTALQREARDAVCSMEGDQIQFVVANLNKPEGRQLAARHGVGKITLLLFDGEGNRQSTITGLNSAENLKIAFQRHVRLHGKS